MSEPRKKLFTIGGHRSLTLWKFFHWLPGCNSDQGTSFKTVFIRCFTDITWWQNCLETFFELFVCSGIYLFTVRTKIFTNDSFCTIMRPVHRWKTHHLQNVTLILINLLVHAVVGSTQNETERPNKWPRIITVYYENCLFVTRRKNQTLNYNCSNKRNNC